MLLQVFKSLSVIRAFTHAWRHALVLLICSFNLHLWMHQFKMYFSSGVFRSVSVLLCSAVQGSEEVTANSVTPPHFWTVFSESFNSNTSGKLNLFRMLVFYQVIFLSFSVKCSTRVVWVCFFCLFLFCLHFTTFPFFFYETGLVASGCKQQGAFLSFSGKILIIPSVHTIISIRGTLRKLELFQDKLARLPVCIS